ncbi:helix-turn-helix domain-containing protein [Umezawaea sp. Da 62-37]|uniref:PucR family transcriptional regulator n=1 Tax=Umezawaea sp. Da 62-37 TaxID=3075927 RepID=UPI0028F6D85A|nr:helix-turn-helix domain-containing protein [Umezawaea sp. Da 62-37]WNV87953.1 helix-turn-helix domain-containing protein [Umezawaea sp. Da 62-37]
MHIDDLGAARIMTAVRQSSDAVAYANSLLSPLRHVNGGLLLDTLRVYLDNRSSLGLTADALNLHRNTVSGRLARIRQLLDVDLDDPEERLALSLACRIAEAEA